jgi:hypothetical protein
MLSHESKVDSWRVKMKAHLRFSSATLSDKRERERERRFECPHARGRREGSHTHGRGWLATQRGDPSQAETDDRDRWETDSLAHHEGLLRLRGQRLRALPRLQGLSHQGILRELLPSYVRRRLRHLAERDGGPPKHGGAVASNSRRHRRRDDDRWTAPASARIRGRRRLLFHLRRRRRRRGHLGRSSASTASAGRSRP